MQGDATQDKQAKALHRDMRRIFPGCDAMPNSEDITYARVALKTWMDEARTVLGEAGGVMQETIAHRTQWMEAISRVLLALDAIKDRVRRAEVKHGVYPRPRETSLFQVTVEGVDYFEEKTHSQMLIVSAPNDIHARMFALDTAEPASATWKVTDCQPFTPVVYVQPAWLTEMMEQRRAREDASAVKP